MGMNRTRRELGLIRFFEGEGENGTGGEQPKEYTAPATQADLDAIIEQRLQRERVKYSDYGTLKEKAGKFDQLQESQKTEVEKALEKGRDEGRKEVRAQANLQVASAQAHTLAVEAKFRNPALALKTMDLDLASVVKDDGTVDTAKIKDALKSLATTDPYLVDDGAAPPKNRPAPNKGQGTPPPTRAGTARERADARLAKLGFKKEA